MHYLRIGKQNELESARKTLNNSPLDDLSSAPQKHGSGKTKPLTDKQLRKRLKKEFVADKRNKGFTFDFESAKKRYFMSDHELSILKNQTPPIAFNVDDVGDDEVKELFETDGKPEEIPSGKKKLTDKEVNSIKEKKRESYVRRKKAHSKVLTNIETKQTLQKKLARKTKKTYLEPIEHGVAERILIEKSDETLTAIEDFRKTKGQKVKEANELHKKKFDRTGRALSTKYRAPAKRVVAELTYKEKAKRITAARKECNLEVRKMNLDRKKEKKARKLANREARKNLPSSESYVSDTEEDFSYFDTSLEDVHSLWLIDENLSTYWSDEMLLLDHLSESGSSSYDVDSDYPSTEAQYGFSSHALGDGTRYLGLGASAVASKLTLSLLEGSDDMTIRIFKVVNIFLAFCTSTSAATDYAIMNLISLDDDFQSIDFSEAWESIKNFPYKKRFRGVNTSLSETEEKSTSEYEDVELTSFPSTEAKEVKNTPAFFMDGDKVVTTPWADTLRSTFREFKFLMEGEFFDTVRSMCFSLVSLVTLPKQSVKMIKRMFGKCETMTIFDAVDKLVASIGKFLEYVELSFKGYSLTTILNKKNAFKILERHYKELEVKFSSISYGLPVGHSTPARDFIIELSDWLKDVKTAYDKSAPFSTENSALLTMRSWGTSKYQAVKSQLQGKRHMPYGIILHGMPGIGKSTILDMIYSIFSDVFGRKFDSGMVYERNTASAFWDQYSPWAQPYIHESELGNTHTSIAKRTGDPALTEMCSIMDCQAYSVDIAVAEKKGTIFVNPELVVIDTNNPNLNAAVSVNNPSAVMRRFLFIKPIVKKEYRTSDGMINTSIVDPETFYDKWTFTATMRIPVTMTSWTEHVVLAKASTDELEAFLQGDIIRHFEQQAAKPLAYTVRNRALTGRLAPVSKHQVPGAHPDSKIDPLEGLDPKIKDAVESSEHSIKKFWNDPNKEEKDDRIDEIANSLVVRDCLTKDNPTMHSTSDPFEEKYFEEESYAEGEHVRVEMIRDGNIIAFNPPGLAILALDIIATEMRKEKLRVKVKKDEIKASYFLVPVATVRVHTPSSIKIELSAIARSYATTERDEDLRSELEHRLNGLEEKDDSEIDIGYDNLTTEAFIPISWVRPHVSAVVSFYSKWFDKERWRHGVYFASQAAQSGVTACSTTIQVFFMIFMSFILIGKKNETIQGIYRTICHFFMIFHFLLAILFWNYRITYVCVPIFLLSLCNIIPLLNYWNRRALKSVINTQLTKLNRSWSDFSLWFNANPYEITLGIVQIGGSLLVIRTIFGLFKTSSDEFETEGSVTSFPVETPITRKANEWEEKLDVSKPVYRVKNNLNGQIWTTINAPTMGTAHNGSARELYNSLRGNIRKFQVCTDEGKVSRSYALGIESNYYLVPRHAFGIGELVNKQVRLATCTDPTENAYVNFVLQPSNHAIFSSDHVILYVSNTNCKNILSHISNTILEMKNATSCVGDDDTITSYIGHFKCHDKALGVIAHDHGLKYIWDNHTVGMCGLPVVWTTSNGTSAIAGVHVAGDLTSRTAFGSMFTRSALKTCIASIETGLMKAHSLGSEDICDFPRAQSLTRYEPCYFPTYLGYVGTNKTFNQKSKLQKTSIAGDIREILDSTYGPQIYNNYDRPLMKAKRGKDNYIHPYNVMFRKVAKIKRTLNMSVLQATVQQITTNICSRLETAGVSYMEPYNLDVAFNGSAYDEYCRSIDLSKSAGYGTPGKKKAYVYSDDEKVFPKDAILEEINSIVDAYSRGETVRVNFEANMKDEPRLLEKVKEGKTRVFYATPFAFYIVMRAFLLPLMNNMSAHSECFSTSIGIDMHRQADLVYDRIKNNSDNVIEGDYSGYDTSMPVEIGLASATITENILSHFGYSEDQLMIVRGILTESIYVCVVINGDKFLMPGLQPSGKLGTAEDNSLRGLVMLVYAWNESPCQHLDFFEHVAVCTYGDDVVASVSDAASEFTAIYYAEFCFEVFGLTFTTAGKGKVEKEFIAPEEMSFLKRTFKYSDVLKRTIAPLAMDSIARMCSWYLPSNNVSLYTQMESTVQSALRELFFHSTEEQYTTMRTYFNMNLLDEEGNLPTFIEVKESLHLDYTRVIEEEHVSNDSYDYPTCEADSTDHLVDTRISCMGFRRPIHLIQWRENSLINDFMDELKEIEHDLNEMEDPYPGFTFRILRKMPCVCNSPSWPYVKLYYSLIAHRDSLVITIQRLEQGELRAKNIFTEADMGEEHTEMENLYDVVGEAPIMEKEDESQYFETGQKNYLGLEDYLSRPLEIASMSVAPGAHLTYSTEIWDAFLDHPSVRAKLRNYAYLRADMNIRVTISGSPFHYSKVMVSYQPYAAHNENITYFGGQLLGTNRQQALCYLSQSPNVGYLDVRDNQPLDMVLPFICAQPMLRLYNNSPLIIADSTPLDDAANLGRVYVNTINTVQSASATPTSISVFIYAWMTNVEFGCPTGTVMTIGTEADMGDERIIGPVERVSSKVASVMNMASKIPVFAPFTSVASTIASTISGMAAIFGFSKPTMNTSPLRTNPQAFQNGAYTLGYDTTKKICLDPMQELTVDAHCVATDTDDMMISELCARESLIDVFSWTDSDVPLGTAIWLSPVNPILADRHLTSGTTYSVCPTPMAWAARPFLFWRGDITYRIEIVCSQYHRGKLAIYYEPNVPQNTVIDTTLDINKQYIKIIDIQEVQDLTFTVEWAFPRAWARIGNANMNFDLGSIGFTGTDWFDSANGYIAIVPFTSLQSPDGSDISINVYTYSDNMLFNRVDGFFQMSRPATEADMGEEKEDVSIVLNPSSASMEHIGQMHFGEIPLSFRALLKRYMARTNPLIGGTGLTTDKALIYNSTLFPAVVPAYTGTASVINLFSYLRYGYLGMKGGMKYRAGVIGKMTIPDCAFANVTLLDERDNVGDTLSTHIANEFFSAYPMGTVSFHIGTNGGVEYELPLYTNNMFLLSFSDDPVPSGETTFDSNYSDSYRVSWPIQTIDTLSNMSVEVNTAIGDDFSFMRFQGCPAYSYTL